MSAQNSAITTTPDLAASNSLADLAARIRAAVDTKHLHVGRFGNDADGGADVDTKTFSCERFGNDANGGAGVDTKLGGSDAFGNDGVGFIRVRKRKLKGGASASFDLVKAVRLGGKPRHEFILGLGSQKDADRDHDLCWFWVRAIHRMTRRGLAEDRRSRLITEMVRKGARVPSVGVCEKHASYWPHYQSEVSEIKTWLHKAEAPPDPNGYPELPACLRRAVP